MGVITAGYLGWIVTVLVYIFNCYTELGNAQALSSFSTSRSNLPSSNFLIRLSIVLLVGYAFLFVQSSPFMYYLYVFFPIAFWGWSIAKAGLIFGYLRETVHSYFRKRGRFTADHLVVSKSNTSIGVSILLSLLCMECMVVGYFYRQIFAVALAGVALWTSTSANKTTLNILSLFGKGQKYTSLQTLWWISCGLVGVFPLLPVDLGENILIVYAFFFLVFMY